MAARIRALAIEGDHVTVLPDPAAVSPNASRIGIIGIGAMGLPMARNLQRRGLAPQVRDVDPAVSNAALSLGLVTCDSAASLAEGCDIIVVVVVDAPQIEEVLF